MCLSPHERMVPYPDRRPHDGCHVRPAVLAHGWILLSDPSESGVRPLNPHSFAARAVGTAPGRPLLACLAKTGPCSETPRASPAARSTKTAAIAIPLHATSEAKTAIRSSRRAH